jgi:hypothetical protein
MALARRAGEASLSIRMTDDRKHGEAVGHETNVTT